MNLDRPYDPINNDIETFRNAPRHKNAHVAHTLFDPMRKNVRHYVIENLRTISTDHLQVAAPAAVVVVVAVANAALVATVAVDLEIETVAVDLEIATAVASILAPFASLAVAMVVGALEIPTVVAAILSPFASLAVATAAIGQITTPWWWWLLHLAR